MTPLLGLALTLLGPFGGSADTDPEFVARLEDVRATVRALSPEELGRILRDDWARERARELEVGESAWIRSQWCREIVREVARRGDTSLAPTLHALALSIETGSVNPDQIELLGALHDLGEPAATLLDLARDHDARAGVSFAAAFVLGREEDPTTYAALEALAVSLRSRGRPPGMPSLEYAFAEARRMRNYQRKHARLATEPERLRYVLQLARATDDTLSHHAPAARWARRVLLERSGAEPRRVAAVLVGAAPGGPPVFPAPVTLCPTPEPPGATDWALELLAPAARDLVERHTRGEIELTYPGADRPWSLALVLGLPLALAIFAFARWRGRRRHASRRGD